TRVPGRSSRHKSTPFDDPLNGSRAINIGFGGLTRPAPPGDQDRTSVRLHDIIGGSMISTIAPQPREDFPARLPIGFPDELYEWLRGAAFRRRISMAELVREAVREYRTRHEPQ